MPLFEWDLRVNETTTNAKQSVIVDEVSQQAKRAALVKQITLGEQVDLTSEVSELAQFDGRQKLLVKCGDWAT